MPPLPEPTPFDFPVVTVAHAAHLGFFASLPPGHASVRIQILGPAAHSASLVVPPDVVSLDLRALAPGAWISLRGGAGLRRLRLPDAPKRTFLADLASGLRGHIDLHLELDAPPDLLIEGCLLGLGARWGPTATPRLWASRIFHRNTTAAVTYLGPNLPPAEADGWLWALPDDADGRDDVDASSLHALTLVEIIGVSPRSLTLDQVTRVEVHGAERLEALRLTAAAAPAPAPAPPAGAPPQRPPRGQSTAALLAQFVGQGKASSRHPWLWPRARINGCPRLQTLALHGHRATIVASGARGALAVEGYAGRLSLVRVGWSAISAPHCTDLTLEDSPRVRHVTAAEGHRFAYRGSTVPAAPHAGEVELLGAAKEDFARTLQAGGTVSPGTVRAMVDGVNGAEGAQAAVASLRAALVGGTLAPAEVWALRTRLRRRLDDRRAHKDGPRLALEWRWAFPRDLADRGWADDLALWWACRDTVPEAAAYDEVVARTAEVEGYAALAMALAGTPALAPFLVRALRCRPPEAPEQATAAHAGLAAPVAAASDGFTRVIRGLVGARDAVDLTPLCEALSLQVARRCRRGWGLIGVLGALRELAAPGADEALALLATDPQVDEGVRREAFAQLIAAPHPDARPLLAPRAPEESP